MKKRKILIAAALPYANGTLHLGHVAGLIGSDILARYHRLNNDDVLFVSGSDCHGTPIAFEAEKNNVAPSVIADKYHTEFKKVLAEGMAFSYDFYTKTTSATHAEVVQEIFLKLYKKNLIYKRTEELPYCETCNKFLPDRYIEGECYICQYDSARGDQCDNCGNLMNAKELVNPKCKNCKNTPIFKDSEHFFLKLTSFQDTLTKWVNNSNGWRVNAKNFTAKFLEQGLHDRSITRDTDWGITIPLEGYDSKKIYVWFEAVCAYLSASKEWAEEIGKKDEWKEFWENESSFHYYIHGKDNIPFHSIIWPSILLGYENLHLPDKIISSEYLTLEKKQFSKSRNWAIWLPDFLENFDSETLRYYLVANGAETSDADFSWKEFMTKTNNELINNFGNYAYRVLSFTRKHFPKGVKSNDQHDEQTTLFLKIMEDSFQEVKNDIENGLFRKGLQQIFRIVEEGNRYFNDKAPWVSIKENPQKTEGDLAIACHALHCLAIMLNPFLPKTSAKLSLQIGKDVHSLKWEYPEIERLEIKEPTPLYRKIEEEEIERQISLLKNQEE